MTEGGVGGGWAVFRVECVVVSHLTTNSQGVNSTDKSKPQWEGPSSRSISVASR